MRAASLAGGGWLPVNHRALSSLLARCRRRRRREAQPTAAFDWDNTCILGDVGDQVFAHQLETGSLGLTAAAAGERLGRWPCIPTTVAADIVAAWRACETAATRPGAPAGWPAAAPLAHADLRARLGWAMRHLLASAGPATGEAYLWQAGWLNGLTPAEVASLAQAAWQTGLGEALGEVTWRTATAGAGGHRAVRWRRGLRRCRQMEALMAALAAAGVEVWVITASHQAAIQTVAGELAAATHGALAPARVVGMRPDLPVGGAPITWRGGKVAAIAAHLPRAPLLCAGDAETDYEMLTHHAPPGLALVIHRDQPAPMDALYRRAIAEAEAARVGGAGGPHILLQGRDESTGDLVASPWRRARR